MQNESRSQRSRPPEVSPSTSNGTKIPSSPRNLILTSVAAVFTWLVYLALESLFAWGHSIGVAHDTLREEYRLHVNDGLRKHELIEKDLENLFEMRVDVRALEDEVSHLEDNLKFPFTTEWQRRIRDLERQIIECQVSVDKVQEGK